MKTLVKWFLKHYLTNEAVKRGVHGLNAKFAEKVKVEGREKVVDVANDASECVSARLEAFKDDGKIDPSELARINAVDDAKIDKYASDEKIAAFIDSIFD